mmetsp:Transcript_57585/g.160381  ORF Transcript_57585/g.160381 Transcript_57585/m.160381 type:complete len:98 (-) Transcript_57585:84-377(-)
MKPGVVNEEPHESVEEVAVNGDLGRLLASVHVSVVSRDGKQRDGRDSGARDDEWCAGAVPMLRRCGAEWRRWPTNELNDVGDPSEVDRDLEAAGTRT